MDQREKYSIIHEVHCALVCELVLRHMGRSAEDRLPLLAAGLTMNLDMLELQDKLFHQRGKLNEEQRREVRNHPYRSVEILQELGVRDDAWLTTVLQHHELVDQSGYPQGLPGNEISEEARILALADIYCAKLYPRAYRAPLQPTAAAYDIFTGARGHGLDKDLSKLFIGELGIFHPGSFVRLRNGELAVVARRGEKIHNPIVYSVVKANGELYIEPRRRDSSNPEFAVDKSIARGDVNIQINTSAIWRRT
jgi:HD-GYP domain-containing protein (c-di-GMP phosphodiesterase class II)